MGQEAVNGILEALKGAQQRRVERTKVAIDQQRADQENEYRKGELDRQNQLLAETKKQHDFENNQTTLTHQAMLAEQKLRQLREQNAIGQDQTGNPDTLLATIPGADGETFEKHSIPGIDGATITLPSKDTINKRLGATKTAELAPQIAGRIQEIGAEGEKAKDVATFQNQLPPTQQQQLVLASEEKRAAEAKAAQMYDTRVQAAAHIRGAQIGAGLEGGDAVNSSAAPYILQVHNGQLTQEGLNALKLPKAIHNAVVAGVSQDGAVLPTTAELGAVSKYAPVAPLVGAIDQYNQLLKDSPMKSRLPGTNEYKKRQALEAQIETQTPGIARSIGTETGRLSNQQIQMSQDLVKPGTNFLTSDPTTNQQKRDTLLGLANSAIDANLSRLPKDQAAAIKAKSGLTAIPYSGAPPKATIPAVTPSAGGQHLYFDSKGNIVQQPGANQ